MKPHISTDNAKLARMLKNPNLDYPLTGIASFSLPAGYSCPEAVECQAKVVRSEGKSKIVDGDKMAFRCFEATMESWNPALFQNNQNNFALLRECKNDIELMAGVLEQAVAQAPRKINLWRVHVGGDFFSANYLRAWFLTARRHPDIRFFAYTKSIRHLVNVGYYPDSGRNEAPDNFSIVASYGGRNDALIGEYGMRSARVVYSETEAAESGLEIDHDDSIAAFGNESFALLLHGTQAKGSKASDALSEIKRLAKIA